MKKLIYGSMVVVGIWFAATTHGYYSTRAKYEGFTVEQIESMIREENRNTSHNPIPATITILAVVGALGCLTDTSVQGALIEMLNRQRDNDWRDGNG